MSVFFIFSEAADENLAVPTNEVLAELGEWFAADEGARNMTAEEIGAAQPDLLLLATRLDMLRALPRKNTLFNVVVEAVEDPPDLATWHFLEKKDRILNVSMISHVKFHIFHYFTCYPVLCRRNQKRRTPTARDATRLSRKYLRRSSSSAVVRTAAIVNIPFCKFHMSLINVPMFNVLVRRLSC